jgi:DNA-binding transcriptional LysR family regulator
VREADTEEALDRLLRDETDVVVGLDGEVRVDDARFARTPLLVDPLDVIVPAGHSRAAAPDLCLADLAEEEWIVPPAGLCRDITLRECASAGFTPRIAHTADSFVAVFALVRAGHGVALAPRMCGAGQAPGLTVRVPRAQQPARQVSLFLRQSASPAPHLRPVVEAFRRTAAEWERSFTSA